MSCKRCEDIHSAQKEGKTQGSCKCNCHETTLTGGTWLTSPTTTTDGVFTFTDISGSGTDTINFTTKDHVVTCTGINCGCSEDL